MFAQRVGNPDRRRLTCGFARILACAILCCIPAVAAEGDPTELQPLKPGAAAPEWTGLKGIDDKLHSLTDLKDRDVIIVCFTCNTCGYSIDYEDRIIALQKKYSDVDQNVAVVAINPNAHVDDELDDMKQRAREKKFNFVYLKDETHRVARAYAAMYTPEFFVLDKSRKIVYTGALDDAAMAEDVQFRYVELAVDAALKGTVPEIQQTAPRGCAVRYPREKRGRKSR